MVSDTSKEFAGRDLIREAMVEALGERCPDFDAECTCCQTWRAYDALTEARAEIERLREDMAENPWKLSDEAAKLIRVAVAEHVRMFSRPMREQVAQYVANPARIFLDARAALQEGK